MILSTAYRQHKAREQAQELKCNLSEMAEAVLYIVDHPDKRLVICANSLDALNTSLPKTIEMLINYDNIFIELTNINDIISLSHQLTLRGVTKQKIVMGLPVRTYNELYIANHYLVSDVYLDEPLVFDLPNVRNRNSEDNFLYIRVRPAQGRNPIYNDPILKDSGLRHFWITPQTTQYYEGYVDILDLTDPNEIREAELFNVYSRQEYNHGLRSLCANMTADLPCTFIDEEAVMRRISCQQRCMMPGNRCHYCDNLNLLYNVIKKRKNEIIH